MYLFQCGLNLKPRIQTVRVEDPSTVEHVPDRGDLDAPFEDFRTVGNLPANVEAANFVASSPIRGITSST